MNGGCKTDLKQDLRKKYLFFLSDASDCITKVGTDDTHEAFISEYLEIQTENSQDVVKSRYNMVQYNTVLYKTLQWK